MKHSLLLAALLMPAVFLEAQEAKTLSLNAYGGYTFRDNVSFDGYYGYVDEGFQYGGGLEYFIRPTKSIELKYVRMETNFPLYSPTGSKLNAGSDAGTISYLLLAGNNYFGNNDQSRLKPFAGLDLGAAFVDIKEGKSNVKFAWGAKLGVKINTASSVSFKLQAYLQNVTSALGSDYYVDPGGGYIAVPDYANILQFGLGGILCFNFRSKK